jgi:hypothetical protein
MTSSISLDFIYNRPEFIQNKYLSWYKAIIENARTRTLDSNISKEIHHILPRSGFPEFIKEKWNLIDLTIREHFVCHLLLPKFTSGNLGIKMNHVIGLFCVNKKHLTSWEFERSRKQCKEKVLGKVPVFNPDFEKDGKKYILVDKNDPRYLSNELISMNTGSKRTEKTKRKMSDAAKGKMTVKDKDGNTFRANCDDPHVLSGKLVPQMKGVKLSEEVCRKNSKAQMGKVTVKDNFGNKYRTTIDDPDYISGRVVHINKGRKHSEELRKKKSDLQQGTMTYIDKDGNTFRAHKNDPLVLSGELVHIAKAKERFHITNPETKENRMIPVGDSVPDGWVKGRSMNKTKKFCITNLETKENKRIPVGDPIPDGWVKGKSMKTKQLELRLSGNISL